MSDTVHPVITTPTANTAPQQIVKAEPPRKRTSPTYFANTGIKFVDQMKDR